jgi:phosphatidylinositol-3-phosphatase
MTSVGRECCRRCPRGARRVAALALCLLVVVESAGGTSAPVPAFEHVLVVVLENKDRGEIVGNPAAPTFNQLARQYASLANYDAVAHPSLPNYLALVSGSTHGIRSDCTSCVVRAPSLADTLERKGLTWKTYAEGLPRPGFEGAWNGRYAKKHDPFLYFADVASSARRRANVVPLQELKRDAATGRLPSFALVVPDQCHDMHSCPIATGDRWLRTHVVPLLQLRSMARSVVFVVFDEGGSGAGGGGHVAALALGPQVRAHATFKGASSHYGLLRTVEAAWGLPLLGDSAKAQPIQGIWRR